MKRREHVQEVSRADLERIEGAERFMENGRIFLTRLRTVDGRDVTPRWMVELMREDENGRP